MLECPINLELYQYEIGDKIIALDVQSSSFFIIDQLTSEILELADEYLTKDIIEILNSEYLEKEIIDRLNYLENLWQSREINTYDRFNGSFYSFHTYELKLHPTSKCNLDCKYCFGDRVHEEKSEISLETAKDAVDFLVHEFGADGQEYKVDLTGSGEPMLRLDFIKELKEYCIKASEEIDKRILVSLCSNGTLLTQEKSSYLKENNILYGVSIDGGQVINDDLRPYQGGKGSFADIIENCKQIKNRDLLGFAVTLTGEYTNVKDIFLELFELDLADTIGIKAIRLPADNEYSINENNIDQVKEGYNELVLFLLSETMKGNTEYFYTLVKGDDYFAKFLKRTIRNQQVIYRCSAGLNSFSVNDQGEMYNCPVELNNPSFAMGNIYEGVNKEEQDRLRSLYADNIRWCQGCWARYLCSGECFAVGELIHNQKERPYRIICEYKKHLIRLSMYFWTELKEENPDIFEALYRTCRTNSW